MFDTRLSMSCGSSGLMGGRCKRLARVLASRLRDHRREGVGDPVSDIGADVGEVIDPDMLGTALLPGEDAQVAGGCVHRLLIGPVRVLQGNLTIVLPVHDQERHRDLVDDAIEVDRVGELDELVEIVIAPDPFDMVREGGISE